MADETTRAATAVDALNACRVMAVGILAHKLRGLIQSAPPGDGKGQR